MNGIFVLGMIAIIVLAVLILLLIGLIWFIFQRPQARFNGELQLPGLKTPVEVMRDRWGAPHLYAETLEDALFAQGFVHAQDRLFQMEYTRRLARGALAEVLGEPALEADRWSRIIGFWRVARQNLNQLEARELDALRAYAAGVNAFIETNHNRLPAEFTLLGYKPTPWTLQDSLGLLTVIAWGFGQNWESELLRLRLLDKLGPERAAELEPGYPPLSPCTVPGAGAATQSVLAQAADRLLDSYRAASHWFGRSALAGSNAWVISPQHTTTQRPLLANDPHLTVSMPVLWFQNHVHVGDGSLHFAGISLPGVPGIAAGHNARIGWGVTAGRADVQDLYVEQRHPEQPTWFRYLGQWEAAQVIKEEIAVRGRAQPHVEEVVITRHGPLINPLAGEDEDHPLPGLALRWAGHEPSQALRGWLNLLTAGDWPSFRGALADIGEPSLNFVYADVAGNIGYQYVARAPLRRAGYGLLPGPGWDDSHEWQGWAPFESLPSALNPDRGHLVSANNKPTAAANAPFLGAEWYPGYRAARIERMLQVKPRYTLRDCQRMQLDVYSVQAETLTPYLVMLDSDNPFERRIIRELEAWNLRVEVDSFAAAAYEVARLHLLELVFGDKLGALGQSYLGRTHSEIFRSSGMAGAAGLCLLRLLEEEQSWWFHDAATGQPRTRQQLLQLALRRTATSLRQMIGEEPRKWAWGKVHQVRFPHLLGRSRLLRAIFDRGQYPIGGDEHTVWMAGFDLQLPFGLVTTSVAYRQVLDVGDWDRSTAVLATGQSGQPGSRHYDDHVEMWREGEQHPLLWTRPAVAAATVYRLWLRPAQPTAGPSAG